MAHSSRPRVLFVCKNHSASSPLAAALLEHLAPGRFEIHSATLEASPVESNPHVRQVLTEIGVEPTPERQRPLVDYWLRFPFSYVITVCDEARDRLPIFPYAGTRMHWPASAQREGLEGLRAVRDGLRQNIEQWLSQPQQRAS